MPQARLPDINTAFIRYRSEVLVGMKKGDWDSMHGSLNGINGLLPQEYQVKISDTKYYELVKEDIEYECNKCKNNDCLLYTSPSPRDATLSRMPSSA